MLENAGVVRVAVSLSHEERLAFNGTAFSDVGAVFAASRTEFHCDGNP